jgi:nitroreductase
MTGRDMPTTDPAWYDAISVRMSRRRFTGEPIPADALDRLRAFAGEFRPFPEVRAAIVGNEPVNVFVGWIGSYGRIDGAPMAALLIGPTGSGEAIGYTGEALVLEATRLGVGTCWVAGNFSRGRAAKVVDLAGGERVICATPLGIATERPAGDELGMRRLVRASRRKPLSEIAPGAETGLWPEWAVTAVEAARIAPSGSNRQPWRFAFEDGSIVLTCPPAAYFTADVDRGIAMLHVELGAAHAGVVGRWERLDAPGVVRFVPETV